MDPVINRYWWRCTKVTLHSLEGDFVKIRSSGSSSLIMINYAYMVW